MKEQEFELKLASGKTVKWTGKNGEHAARRYVSIHTDETVIAWRYLRYDFKVGMIKIHDETK